MTHLNNLFQNIPNPSAWCISNNLIANGAGIFKQSMGAKNQVGIELLFRPARLHRLGLGTEFRSEKIPRNILGMVSVIPRKKVLIQRHSEFRGRANSEARNGMERNGIPRKY
jgi:hypothetical protein